MCCELNAAYFHLYGIDRDAAYLMDTFLILNRKDEPAQGTYWTNDTIVEIHDAMADAIRICTPYQTRLDPRQHTPPSPKITRDARSG